VKIDTVFALERAASVTLLLRHDCSVTARKVA